MFLKVEGKDKNPIFLKKVLKNKWPTDVWKNS